MASSVYDFQVKDINGQEVSLAEYKGKYLLIVNVASKCGFTPQYEGLEILRREMAPVAEVLGFPCNQFGKQEPGDETEIKNFCKLSYDVSFPLFAKIDVNGKGASPLYQYLKEKRPGALGLKAIKWNFTKFLVDPEGQVIKRYAPFVKPEEILSDLKSMIKNGG